MDKQGRIILPARTRKALEMEKGGELLARLDGSRIILEPFPGDLEKKVEDWVSLALSLKAEARSEGFEESWKWMSPGYAKRKLGLS